MKLKIRPLDRHTFKKAGTSTFGLFRLSGGGIFGRELTVGLNCFLFTVLVDWIRNEN